MRVIAATEILGGLAGIPIAIWSFLTSPFNGFALTIFAPIIVAIYVLSIVAGVALWRGAELGRRASIVVQAIQLPKVTSSIFVFMFSFGFDLWVQIVSLSFHLRFLAFHQLFINKPGTPFDLGVSVPALIFLALLRKHRTVAISNTHMPPPPPAEWIGINAAPNKRLQLTRCHDVSYLR